MAAPTYIHSGAKQGSQSTNTPPAPASWLADDILLLTCESNGEAISLSSAQGFAEVTNSPQTAGAASTRIAVFWKRATSTSDTMPTVGDPGDHVGVQMHVFRGCKTSGDPWNATDGGNTTTGSTSWATDGVTTTVADCLIVDICAMGFDTATAQSSAEANANLGSFTFVQDSWMSLGDGGGFVVTTGTKASAGATGSTTGTFANSARNAYLTIALEPPGGAPQNVSPDAIALTLTPVAPIAAQSNLSPDALALTVTPVAPIAAQSNLSPDALALTFTPVAPAVTTAGPTASPGPIALTLTAPAPYDITGGAITFTNLGASAAPDITDGTDTSTYSTASWTPPNGGGGLIIAAVLSREVSGASPIATPTMSGNNIDWGGLGTVESGGTALHRLTLFVASSVDSTTGTTTIDFGGQTQTFCFVSFSYVHQVEDIVQAPTATATTGTTATVSLSAASDTDNRMFAAAGNGQTTGGTNVVPRTNWTELDELTTSQNRALETQYRGDATETTGSATWTGSGPWTIIAAEFDHREVGLVAQEVTPAPIALTLSPVAPSVLQAQLVTPGVITYSVTPLQPAIAQKVVAPALALTLTPVAPIAAQSNLSPGAIVLTVTPVAPVPVQTNLSPGAISLTLTPVAPVPAQTNLSPGAISLTLTPVAPSISQAGAGQSVTPGAVPLSVTAVAPTVGQRLAPGVLSLTLTPVAPGVTQRVAAGVVSLTLTPVAPAATQPQNVSPGALALTLTPRAPVVSGEAGVGGLNADPTATVRIGATWWDPLNVDPTKAAGRVHDVEYAGGYFYIATEGADRAQTLAGVTHTCNSLIRVNATTMDLDTSWFPTFSHPATTNELHSITTDGTTVWVTGIFTSMTLGATTYPRSRIIALDAVTGIPTSWSAGTINNTVRGITYDDGHLYIVGTFTSVTASTRNHAACLASSNGALETWNPNLSPRGNDIDLFTATGGVKYLAIAMNAAGTVNGAGSYTFTLVQAMGEASPGTALWSKNEGSGGGHVCAASDDKQRVFYGTKGSGGNVVWCYNAAGTKQWSGNSINTNGDIQALEVYKGRHTEDLLYVGTHDTSFSSTPGGSAGANVGSGFARFDIDTGNFDSSYFPEFKQDGGAPEPYDGHTLKLWRIRGFENLDMLAVGGDFQRVDTANGRVTPDPRRIAIFAETGGPATPSNQNVTINGPIALSIVFPGTSWGGPWGSDGWDAGLSIQQGVTSSPQTVSPAAIPLSITAPSPTCRLRVTPPSIGLSITVPAPAPVHERELFAPAVALTLTPRGLLVQVESGPQTVMAGTIALTLTPQEPLITRVFVEPGPIALTLSLAGPRVNAEAPSGFGPSFGKPADPVFHGFVPSGRRLLFTRPK